ncbi:MAG TPA: ABC transporter substrate-binding protein [Oligoflexus sp.]|uniref:ABC transporter substrate-binding protein n=1 Tax=Oligoflexus sp. TaxID=1971216 RepID=UPI002D40F9C1|nr:ABC transporter substrate-binding protein [Oligoflexus sp.]HYX31555.1 ABC transporter substrate-binding protein [Oligoflexus sp.]
MQTRHTSVRSRSFVQLIVWAGIPFVAACLLIFAFRDRLFRLRTPVPALKVDYPDDPIRVQDWDPARSQIDFEVAMAQALYSPLLELDDNAQLKSGWAETFTWKDQHSLVLKLRRDHKRADGSIITADDARVSLKRLAFLQQNEDGFYVEQFCYTKRLDSIAAECPGLTAEGQTLTIRTRDPVAILPQLLTAVDTSIVPITALAEDGLTLRDHPRGSGPYTWDRTPSGEVILKANPLHFNYHPLMPQAIHLVPDVNTSPESLTRAFNENRIDHAARFSALNSFEFKKLADALGDRINTQSTLPMGIGLLLFSEESRKRLPIPVKRELTLRLQAATARCLAAAGQDKIRRPTRSLIPPTSVGMLSPAEEAALAAARQQHGIIPFSIPVRIRFPSYIGDELVPCLSRDLQGVPVTFNRTPDEEADLRFQGYDLSTYEEVGSIRTMLTTGLLDAAELTPEAWISRYIAERDTGKRVTLLKTAHLRAIWEDPSVIPLWHFETGALIRKPWVMKFSILSISNPFHLIRYGE